MAGVSISVAFVLKASLVLEEVLPQVEEALERVGIEVSGIGKTTISGAMSLDAFEDVFGITPKSTRPSHRMIETWVHLPASLLTKHFQSLPSLNALSNISVYCRLQYDYRTPGPNRVD